MHTDREIAGALTYRIQHLQPRDAAFAQSLLQSFDRFHSFTERQRPHAERLAFPQAAAPAAQKRP